MRAALLAGFLAASAVALGQQPVRATETGPRSTIDAAALLDGRTFGTSIVRASLAEQSRELGDKLTFSNGMFSSALCKQYNFSDAPYWVRREGDQVHFLAELTSPTDGRMVWKGIIRGDTLEGTMRWTKERWYWTIDTEHKIQGTLEKTSGGARRAAD